ncbi:OmpA family protein [Fulvivirgaceae bacterium BMA10]|uniref:OmpA family protein n=1 Tax=Splendidivirga corallicola TaxID=3051826 RepID=A0ABT8KH30_9BACT|nr:OmpA family protein [Fulvivirgaceae bacterium BMA10]
MIKKLRNLLLPILTFFFFQPIYSQQIQWASTVDFKFNEFKNSEASSAQALGIPNAFPHGSLNKNAFRLKSESTFGTLVVNYENAQEVRHVVIVESFVPGRITNVILHTLEGGRIQVYANDPYNHPRDSRTFCISVPESENLIAKVEVNIDTQELIGWPQIDAIGISEEANPNKLESVLLKLGLENIEEEMSFSEKKINLGSNINTHYNETKPVISPDGKTLYFCRQNFPANINGIVDPQDIYFSNLIGDSWSAAENIGEPLNDAFSNGVNTVSPDGNSLLLINEYDDREGSLNGVSLTYRTQDGWSVPERLNINDYYNLSEYADFFLSTDGKALIMAVEREEGYGDQDLFVSFDQWGNNWSEPLNLGAMINTSEAEFSPFLAADGKTLYFSSSGHGGFGKSDIFYTKRLDDTWLNWSKPKNLGSMINSPDHDAYYSTTAKGEYVYFVSSKGSNSGSKDIYRIQLPKEIKPEPVVMMAGSIIDSYTKKPVDATLVINNLKTKEESANVRTNPRNGEYIAVLPVGRNYEFFVQAKGYLNILDTAHFAKYRQFTEVQKDIELERIEVGKTVVMKNIIFEQGEANLLSSSFPELERLVQFMNINPGIEIELGGHTDRTGSQKLNMELSERRVVVAKKYLVAKGVDEKRLKVKAYGSTQPIASNASEETRRLNRRVEIKILKFTE